MTAIGEELIRLSLKLMKQRGQLSSDRRRRTLSVGFDHYWILIEDIDRGELQLRVRHHSRTAPNNERWSKVFKVNETTGAVSWAGPSLFH